MEDPPGAGPGGRKSGQQLRSKKTSKFPGPAASSVVDEPSAVVRAPAGELDAQKQLIPLLQAAVAKLLQVQPSLVAVSQDQPSTGLPVTRSLERVRIVKKSLDEVLELAAASKDEEALVKATLRQHERALQTREKADAQSEQEQQHIAGLRWEITELERSMLRSQRTHRRLGIEGSAQRLDEFERQRTNVEGVHNNLTNDLHTIQESLVGQLRQNGDIRESMRQICQAKEVAMEENAKANQLLASGETLDVYRKAKDRERISAEADLAEAQAECQAEMARLHEGWSATEAKYNSEMLALQTEVRSTQQILDKKRREVDQALSQQHKEWSKCTDDMGKQIHYGMKTLEDLRMSKAQHLQREVQLSRQREQDLMTSTKRVLEAQLNEVEYHCKTKLATEEYRLDEEMRADRLAVDAAKKNADKWGKRVCSMREAFKAHAYKTGAYKLAQQIDAPPPKVFEDQSGPWGY